jgi:hypothetical protein
MERDRGRSLRRSGAIGIIVEAFGSVSFTVGYRPTVAFRGDYRKS